MSEGIIDVEGVDVVAEAHDKFDALIKLLEDKGVLVSGEFDRYYEKILERKFND